MAAQDGHGTVFTLQELDGAPCEARATILWPVDGRASGDAPCNAWTANQTAPYPSFSLGPIAATRRACPDLEAETVFLNALAEMTVADLQEGRLMLSNEAGRSMAFRGPER